MQHVLNTAEISTRISSGVFSQMAHKPTTLGQRFLTWCEGEEKRRMLWLALTFLGQIGLVLPCTLFAILVFGGNNFNLWILTCIINVPVLAINLAAQPTKVTIPALLFAWTVDVVIILGCVAAYFL